MVTAAINGFAKSGKKAIFAVLLKDGLGHEMSKVVPLESKSIYLAELAALKYALLAISNKEVEVEVMTSMKHLPTLFVKTAGEWTKTNIGYKKLVGELRTLSEQFLSFECKLDTKSDDVQSVRKTTRDYYN